MSTTNVDGLEMYYEIEGDGPAVVFIGGMTQDHVGWMTQVPAVSAAGYRCVTFDSRDAGQTAPSAKPYDIRQMAGDTLGLMDAIGVSSAHIVGLSMGGMIGQEMAIDSPHRVSSLTLVCTCAAIEPQMAGILRAWKAARPHCDEVDFVLMLSSWLFTHRFYQHAAAVEGFLQLVRNNPFPQSVAGFIRQCDAVLAHDTRDRVSAITTPTRVIVGTEDALTPARYSQWLADSIPGAELIQVPNAAHLLSLETPDEFNRVLIEFLQAQPKAVAVT
jgi:pimeloyl-ACP methyl ester carboxylesterase